MHRLKCSYSNEALTSFFFESWSNDTRTFEVSLVAVFQEASSSVGESGTNTHRGWLFTKAAFSLKGVLVGQALSSPPAPLLLRYLKQNQTHTCVLPTCCLLCLSSPAPLHPVPKTKAREQDGKGSQITLKR